jgi:glycerol-3-phosphate acyltransferase PlsY
MNIVLSIILGYLVGSIPFALILGKKFGGIDVR